MQDFYIYTIGDIATVKGGKRLPKGTSLISTPNEHPYIRIRDLGSRKILELNSEYEYVDEETQKSISRYIVDEGDVLISIVGTIGLTAIVGKSLNGANLTENCVKLINLHNVNRDYLYYFLSSNLGQEEIKRGTVGAVQPKLPIKNIQAIRIPLPDMQTQDKIASILSEIDSKILLNEVVNKNLEAQASAIFYNQYISEQWPMASLQDISSIRYGKGLPTNKLTEDGYYVFGGNGIIGKYNDFMYEKPQILVSCRGAASGKIVESYPKSFVTNNSLILEWKDYRYYELMKQYLLLNPLYEYRTGSAQPQITVDNIKNVLVPYPEYKKVSELCNTLKIISGLGYQNNVQSIRLQKLRDSLLPRLMSGELDVSNVEI